MTTMVRQGTEKVPSRGPKAQKVAKKTALTMSSWVRKEAGTLLRTRS